MCHSVGPVMPIIVVCTLCSSKDPDTRCSSFGFCPTIDHLSPPAGVKNVMTIVREATPSHLGSSSTECILCEYIMREIDQILANNKTEVLTTTAFEAY